MMEQGRSQRDLAKVLARTRMKTGQPEPHGANLVLDIRAESTREF